MSHLIAASYKSLWGKLERYSNPEVRDEQESAER